MSRLSQAPLQEVILEVKWGLTLDPSTRTLNDPGYELAVGKFHNLLKGRLPLARQKFPDQIPLPFIGNQIKHQFWKGEDTWPVVQLGPGIMAVNETDKTYDWVISFYPLVEDSLKSLIEAYEKELVFTNYSLRYIDTVRISDHVFKNWESFIENSLNIRFFNSFNTRGPLKNFVFEQSFDIGQDGTLLITLSSGQNNKKEDIFAWQTVVACETQIEQSELLNWINRAHKCSSDIFKEICKPEFYATFNR